MTINTIKDLYCAVLREIATTCDYAVTNCHGIYSPHLQSEILPKLPSPFEIKVIPIRPPGFEPGTPSTPRKCATRLMFWLTDLSPLHRNLLRTEQLSGSTSSQNILESTFSVEKQKIFGVGSGLVGD